MVKLSDSAVYILADCTSCSKQTILWEKEGAVLRNMRCYFCGYPFFSGVRSAENFRRLMFMAGGDIRTAEDFMERSRG